MRAFAILAVAFLAACSVSSPKPASDSVVKITDGKGHGSGLHIGDGYIVTATHVVGKNEKITVKTSAGKSQEAEILWANKTYDIALLRVEKPEEIGIAALSCRVPAVGERIVAKGNPANMEFITVWGKVAGSERTVGPWRSVVVTDIVTVPGQSGGPVFDEKGDVIGITVGVMASGNMFALSLVAIGYVVPASVVCGLLARGA